MRFQHIKDPPQKSERWGKQQRIQSPSQPMHFSLRSWKNQPLDSLISSAQQIWKLTTKKNFKHFWQCFFLLGHLKKKKKHNFSTVFAPDIQFRPRHSETQRVGFLAPFYRLMLFRKWKQILEQVEQSGEKNEQSCRHSKMRTTTKKCWIQDQVVIGDLVILFFGFPSKSALNLVSVFGQGSSG